MKKIIFVFLLFSIIEIFPSDDIEYSKNVLFTTFPYGNIHYDINNNILISFYNGDNLVVRLDYQEDPPRVEDVTLGKFYKNLIKDPKSKLIGNYLVIQVTSDQLILLNTVNLDYIIKEIDKYDISDVFINNNRLLVYRKQTVDEYVIAKDELMFLKTNIYEENNINSFDLLKLDYKDYMFTIDNSWISLYKNFSRTDKVFTYYHDFSSFSQKKLYSFNNEKLAISLNDNIAIFNNEGFSKFLYPPGLDEVTKLDFNLNANKLLILQNTLKYMLYDFESNQFDVLLLNNSIFVRWHPDNNKILYFFDASTKEFYEIVLN